MRLKHEHLGGTFLSCDFPELSFDGDWLFDVEGEGLDFVGWGLDEPVHEHERTELDVLEAVGLWLLGAWGRLVPRGPDPLELSVQLLHLNHNSPEKLLEPVLPPPGLLNLLLEVVPFLGEAVQDAGAGPLRLELVHAAFQVREGRQSLF
jgi:hypothetical protein